MPEPYEFSYDLSDDERELVDAFREGGQGAVLEWLGQTNPPPDYAIKQAQEFGGPHDVVSIDAHPLWSEVDGGGGWVSIWVLTSGPDEEDK